MQGYLFPVLLQILPYYISTTYYSTAQPDTLRIKTLLCNLIGIYE